MSCDCLFFMWWLVVCLLPISLNPLLTFYPIPRSGRLAGKCATTKIYPSGCRITTFYTAVIAHRFPHSALASNRFSACTRKLATSGHISWAALPSSAWLCTSFRVPRLRFKLRRRLSLAPFSSGPLCAWDSHSHSTH